MAKIYRVGRSLRGGEALSGGEMAAGGRAAKKAAGKVSATACWHQRICG